MAGSDPGSDGDSEDSDPYGYRSWLRGEDRLRGSSPDYSRFLGVNDGRAAYANDEPLEVWISLRALLV